MNTPTPESQPAVRPLPEEVEANSPGDLEVKNGVVYYRGSRPFEELDFPPETEANAEDYDWAMQDPQVRREYGGLIVAVRGRKVWGAGKTPRAASEQAGKTPGCPDLDELVFVAVPAPGFGPSARMP